MNYENVDTVKVADQPGLHNETLTKINQKNGVLLQFQPKNKNNNNINKPYSYLTSKNFNRMPEQEAITLGFFWHS